jgi:oligopeptide transport system permease protein
MGSPGAMNAQSLFAEAEAGASLWQDARYRLQKNRLAMAGAVILICVAAAAALGPMVVPYRYEQQNRDYSYAPPSSQHWFGTDHLGRDLFVRVLVGGRISLLVGLAATAVSLVVGLLYGATAGFVGGRLDRTMMGIVDVLYALPFTILAIILVTYFGRNIILVFVAIGAVEWLTMARIVRGQILSLKKKEFIEAAVAMGLTRRRILLRHLIPNTLGPVVVYATLTVPRVMLLEAFLSYLGLGVQAPMSSWGTLIKEGAAAMEEYPWLLIFPGAVMSLTLFSLNFLGDGLRDALDPRAAKD